MQLFWLRSDLRHIDNTALSAAAKRGPTLAVYLISPEQWLAHDDAPSKVDFWLRNLRDWMSEQSGKGERYSVVTCSALKRQYRDILREAEGEVVFIHLAPPHDVNLARMMARKGHYMKAEMLTSQEAILEELGADEAGVRIDNAGEPAEVEAEMLAWVKAQGFGG